MCLMDFLELFSQEPFIPITDASNCLSRGWHHDQNPSVLHFSLNPTEDTSYLLPWSKPGKTPTFARNSLFLSVLQQNMGSLLWYLFREGHTKKLPNWKAKCKHQTSQRWKAGRACVFSNFSILRKSSKIFSAQTTVQVISSPTLEVSVTCIFLQQSLASP